MKKDAQPVTVHLKELRLPVLIGTRPEERLAPREISMDISFEYDGRLAAQTDALGHAVDYGLLHDRIVKEVSLTRFALLERLAGFVLELLMQDQRILRGWVVIEKTGMFPDLRSVAVKMSAERGEDLSSKAALRCY